MPPASCRRPSGIDQLRADETGVRRFVEAAHERFEPARGHARVVVEEDEQLALRGGCIAKYVLVDIVILSRI